MYSEQYKHLGFLFCVTLIVKKKNNDFFKASNVCGLFDTLKISLNVIVFSKILSLYMKDQTIYKYIVRDLLVVVWPSDAKSGQ